MKSDRTVRNTVQLFCLVVTSLVITAKVNFSPWSLSQCLSCFFFFCEMSFSSICNVSSSVVNDFQQIHCSLAKLQSYLRIEARVILPLLNAKKIFNVAISRTLTLNKERKDSVTQFPLTQHLH